MKGWLVLTFGGYGSKCFVFVYPYPYKEVGWPYLSIFYTIKREDLILCVAYLPSTINQSSCLCVRKVAYIVAFVIHSYDYSD